MKKIYFVPFVKFELVSKFSKDTVIRNLRNNTTVVSDFSGRKSLLETKVYEGIITNHNFSIRRVMTVGYSAFLPIISGNINEIDKKTIVKFKIQFSKFINLFLLVFAMLMLTIPVVQFLPKNDVESKLTEVNQILSENDLDKIVLPESGIGELLSIFIFIYIVIIAFFNYEIRLVEMDLREILGSISCSKLSNTDAALFYNKER